MNADIRRHLVAAAQDIRLRELLTFLYRDHPQGASFEGLTEMLFLHEDFQDTRLQPLIEQKLLIFDGSRYKIAAEARQLLDRDPLILMDEFLR